MNFGIKHTVKHWIMSKRSRKEEKINQGIVAFVHIEKEDEERESKLKDKAVDNIRWLLKSQYKYCSLLFCTFI